MESKTQYAEALSRLTSLFKLVRCDCERDCDGLRDSIR